MHAGPCKHMLRAPGQYACTLSPFHVCVCVCAGGQVGIARLHVLPAIGPRESLALVALGLLPAVLALLRRPQPHRLPPAFSYVLLTGFWLGYHVHEKAIIPVSNTHTHTHTHTGTRACARVDWSGLGSRRMYTDPCLLCLIVCVCVCVCVSQALLPLTVTAVSSRSAAQDWLVLTAAGSVGLLPLLHEVSLLHFLAQTHARTHHTHFHRFACMRACVLYGRLRTTNEHNLALTCVRPHIFVCVCVCVCVCVRAASRVPRQDPHLSRVLATLSLHPRIRTQRRQQGAGA